MSIKKRWPGHGTIVPGDWDGCTSLAVSLVSRADSGFVYQMVTPSFPKITRAISFQPLEQLDVVVRLRFPNALGLSPEIDESRLPIPVDSEFRASVIRSRDWAEINCSRIGPGELVEEGFYQLPLSIGDYLADPELIN